MAKNRVDAGRGRRPGVVKSTRGGSRRGFYAMLGAIALIGAALIGYLVTRPKAVPVATIDSTAGPAQAEGYLMGNANAPVQVMEFGDFACPSCAQFAILAAPDIKQRLALTGQVAFRFYDFPLNIPGHQNSPFAHLAAACANDQGKFWEMHDALFQAQPNWTSDRNPKDSFQSYARAVGLNMEQWEACYDSQRHMARVRANQQEGERRGISSTPTLIIGNRVIPGAISYDRFKAIVDSVRAEMPASPAGDSMRPSAPRAGG